MKNKRQTPNQLNAIGVEQCKNKKYSDAEKFFRKALIEDNENTVFLSNLAYSLRQQEKYDEAERVLSEALRIDPKNKALWSDIGLVQALQSDYEKAKESCLQAIHLDPTNKFFNQNLAYLESQLKLRASSMMVVTDVVLPSNVDSTEVVQGMLQKESSQSSFLKL